MRRKTTTNIPTSNTENLDRVNMFQRDLRWEKLDNTAHLFPVIAGERMSNVYRISVTLSEKIVPELLQKALDIVLPKFDGFNMRLRRGIFWHYFEENGKPVPEVTEERRRGYISLSVYPGKYKQQLLISSHILQVSYQSGGFPCAHRWDGWAELPSGINIPVPATAPSGVKSTGYL